MMYHKLCSGRRFFAWQEENSPIAYGDNPLSLLPMVAASSPRRWSWHGVSRD